uniref:Uncharacterized protein n=1 Tax=Roseihalotalea indica TaxID=2867963 RepID=A0AA49GQC9_9BACT|nr:hypothetical protein K4G66_31075 [Tunicatimonas sp. TK19036]
MLLIDTEGLSQYYQVNNGRFTVPAKAKVRIVCQISSLGSSQADSNWPGVVQDCTLTVRL